MERGRGRDGEIDRRSPPLPAIDRVVSTEVYGECSDVRERERERESEGEKEEKEDNHIQLPQTTFSPNNHILSD